MELNSNSNPLLHYYEPISAASSDSRPADATGIWKRADLLVDLLDQGCCLRCSIRLSSRHIPIESILLKDEVLVTYAFQMLQKHSSKWLHLTQDVFEMKLKDSGKWVCRCCLGILKILLENEGSAFQESLSENFTKARYEGLTSFKCSVSLPVSVHIRQRDFACYVNKSAFFANLPKITDDHPVPLKSLVKTVVESRAAGVLSPLTCNAASPFEVTVSFSHAESDHEFDFFAKLPGVSQLVQNSGMKRKAGGSNASVVPSVTAVIKGLQAINQTKYGQLVKELPPQYSSAAKLEVSLSRQSIYVCGRYNKYSRLVSQSPWLLEESHPDFRKSVEEVIGGKLAPVLDAKQLIFQASGREDIDVRMLGSGRPFAVEAVDPRIGELVVGVQGLKAVQDLINEGVKEHSVRVRNLQFATKDEVYNNISDKRLDSLENKQKTYRALVRIDREITEADLARLNAIRDLDIDQFTPLRVLHRRSLMKRKRRIVKVSATKISSFAMSIELITQAGTYIKEFVHGDLGRTVPSVRQMLQCDADILRLDVLNVDLNFPNDSVNPI